MIRTRAPILLACIAACVLANFLMGKDMNADMLAYHVYAAHMFWTGGYRDEFMGAGLQSFFNPVGYLPVYGMLKAGWSSLVIASCLAAVHALNVFMIWLIGRDFLFRSFAKPAQLATLGSLLAGISPVFIATLGSSFLDPVQSALLLAGLYALMRGIEQPSGRGEMLVAGLLMGASTGLKPTVAAASVFATLGLLVVCWQMGLADLLKKRLAPWMAGLVAGGLLTGGYWAAHLWSRFGSPVFPFANDLFKAPDFFAVPLTTDRFANQGLLDVLAFPFRMAKINSGIYVEIAAPDIRFALLILALVALAFSQRWHARTALPADLRPSTPPVNLVWIVFAAGTLLWMIKLGNGRYHLLYLLLAGPLLLWTLARLWRNPVGVSLAGGLILAVQFAHALSMGYPRWDSGNWTDTWVKTWWPPQVARVPATYVQVGPGIDTSVFADFPAGSRFVDVGGKYPVAPDSPPASRINALLSDTSMPRYVLFKHRASDEKTWTKPRGLNEASLEQINHLLAPWNLHVAGDICHPFEVELDRDEIPDGKGGQLTLGVKRYALLICPVATGVVTPPEWERERQRMARISQALMKACPLLFPAPASLPTRLAGVWNVRFIGADTLVMLHQGHLTYSRYPFGPFNQEIQPDARTGEPVVDCRLPPRAW